MMGSARFVLLERHRAELEGLLFDVPNVEGAAFILCGQAATDERPKLISHAVVPISGDDILKREADGLTIQSRALARITKLARYERLSIVFAHSHPSGWAHFSDQDDREEDRLIPFLHARVPDRLHGTLVMTEDSFAARVYAPQREDAAVFVIGRQYRMFAAGARLPVPRVFDRQVRAFGPDIQSILGCLHVGIVGVGGTGSPLAEQLVRLGVGRITVFDGDKLEDTNINRVFGSSLADVGIPKVFVAKAHLGRIGTTTSIDAVPHPITEETAARRLRECDVVFGCTDKQIPRAILGQLALKYTIPVIDLGVVIDSAEGRLRGVYGRLTTLQPGEACLYCRGRISSEVMRIESLSPEERAKQARAGYAPELDTPAPAVVPFTAAVACFAVTELLHRLTGFMGAERESSEVLITFDQSRIRTNRVESRQECTCGDPAEWGRGDEVPFLGLTWPTATR